MASVGSVIFAGEIIGSCFWGSFGDVMGRRTAFFWAATIIFVFGFASALVPNLWSLLLCRGIVGFGVAGIVVPFGQCSIYTASEREKQRPADD